MRTTPRRDMLPSWVIGWTICAAEWLLLVDRTSVQELVVGAAIAAVGATAALLLRRHRQLVLRRRAVPLRPLAGLVTDLPRLVGALRHRRDGELVEVPFEGDA